MSSHRDRYRGGISLIKGRGNGAWNVLLDMSRGKQEQGHDDHVLYVTLD